VTLVIVIARRFVLLDADIRCELTIGPSSEYIGNLSQIYSSFTIFISVPNSLILNLLIIKLLIYILFLRIESLE